MTPEAVSLILPVLNRATELPSVVKSWQQFFQDLSRDYEILLVDYGSTDDTPEVAAKLAEDEKTIRALTLPSSSGFGAALKGGFEIARYPLIAYSALDYPYTPSDLAKMLDRIQEVDPLLNRPIDLVSGCRQGQNSPVIWSMIGQAYRLFCRVVMGLPLQSPLGWLGVREHWRSWVVWFLFGDPLTDPNSAFKVIRRSVLDRFPIQSVGDFVHVEIVGKATFTTCLMDELPLTPQPVAVPSVPWADFWTVFNDPKFHPLEPTVVAANG